MQIVQFGKDLCIVALEFGDRGRLFAQAQKRIDDPAGPAVWIAGYSNVMEGYIPSRRVLLEGGYEAESRPWNPTLEERIVAKVHELYTRLNP